MKRTMATERNGKVCSSFVEQLWLCDNNKAMQPLAVNKPIFLECTQQLGRRELVRNNAAHSAACSQQQHLAIHELHNFH